MPQPEIYESAGVVLFFFLDKRSAVSPLQGNTRGEGGGGCWTSTSRHADALPLCCSGFLWICACKLGARGNRVSTSALWVCKYLSMTQHIFGWLLHCAVRERESAQSACHILGLLLQGPQRVALVQPCVSLCLKKLSLWMWQRNPQLLAAKQHKGFPYMAKHPGCAARRGVSWAHGASCFLSVPPPTPPHTLRASDCYCGEFSRLRFNNELSRFVAAGLLLTRLCSGCMSSVGFLRCSKWIRTVPLRV